MALLVLRSAVVVVAILWLVAVLAPRIARADGLKSNRSTRFEILPNATAPAKESPTLATNFSILPNATSAEARARPLTLADFTVLPDATSVVWDLAHFPNFTGDTRWIRVSTHHRNIDFQSSGMWGSAPHGSWGPATSTLGASGGPAASSQGSVAGGSAAAAVTSDPTSPTFGRLPEIVELRCLWPSELRRGEVYSLFVYMYAGIDGYEQAKEDFLQRLDATEQLLDASGGDGELQEEMEILIVPRVPGVEFDPPRMKRLWKGSFEKCEFRFRVTRAASEEPEGGVSFYAGLAVVGKTPLTFRIIEDPAAAASDEMSESVQFPYRSVFICYAHEDATMVDRIERMDRALRLTPLRDIHVLKSGETWQLRLRDLIEEADVFQLCWSAAAQRSPHVRSEWTYALALGKKDFIWPVYWEEPMPERPADLGELHFSRI